ncbi:hypothetical protein [Streptomyces sp. NBC_01353]|uniref:hypothetical protein n=1 Tax=Streptomyces sp. NBC_01353 TaxID=2903835 RepID=UPI002E35EE06|nr:hypothetical protein [Streptomyces sp. NBC_01353]
MSITSSIPVLQGRGGSVLYAEEQGLVLERPGEVVTFLAGSVGRVHAEGRSVTLELRAKAGVTPVTYRIEDVSEAAAVVFADALNALLPVPTDDIDGTSYTVVRSLSPTWHQRFLRRIKWLVIGCLGAVVALCVVVAVAGQAGIIIGLVPVGGITTAGLGVGAYTVGRWIRERRLIRHGVMVFATPSDAPGVYLYTDNTGTTRPLAYWGSEPFVQAGYDPRDPSDALVPQAPLLRRLNFALGLFIAFCALNGVAMLVFLTVDAVTGGSFSEGAV